MRAIVGAFLMAALTTGAWASSAQAKTQHTEAKQAPSSNTSTAPGTTTPPKQQQQTPPPAPSPAPGNPSPELNFDLNLGAPPPLPSNALTPEKLQAIKTRRLMLTLHQGFGIALAATTIGSVITGQLNYDDKFLGTNSNRYRLAHQFFVYPTEALAVVTASLAIFAPVPIEKEHHGFDRMTLHKIGEFSAFAGWMTELVLGLVTSSREGFANQQTLAAVHLGIGYFTAASMLVGVGAIVF